jgi:hypothetical protein
MRVDRVPNRACGAPGTLTPQSLILNLGCCPSSRIHPAESKSTHRPGEFGVRVVKIIKERYIDNRAEVAEQEYCEAAQVVSAIENMNGKDCTLVVFSMDEGTVFSVGGGNDNRYVVFIAVATDKAFFMLNDPSKRESECVDLIVGGQRGSYPIGRCVEKASALQAALYFCRFGTQDPSLNWQED